MSPAVILTSVWLSSAQRTTTRQRVQRVSSSVNAFRVTARADGVLRDRIMHFFLLRPTELAFVLFIAPRQIRLCGCSKVGDVVLAKIKGFPAWPGIVSELGLPFPICSSHSEPGWRLRIPPAVGPGSSPIPHSG